MNLYQNINFNTKSIWILKKNPQSQQYLALLVKLRNPSKNHDILLQKLKYYGIRDYSLKLFNSDFSDRKQ